MFRLPCFRHFLKQPSLSASSKLQRITTTLPRSSRAFHTRSFVSITKADIEQQSDIRVLLDEHVKPDLPPEDREKRLKTLIQEIKSLTSDSAATTAVAGSTTANEQPSDKETQFLKMAHVYRGKALSELNRKEEALEEITKGEALSPDAVLYFEKARIYTMMNQYSSAIRYLGKTVNELLPGDPLYIEALVTRAQCYSQVGDKIKALQDISEAIFYQPENLRARLERGRFLLDDNTDAAIDEYESVLDADNIDNDTQAEAYFRIGYAYLKKGEPDVAIRSLLQSKRLDPNHQRVTLLNEILNDLEEKIPKLMDEGKQGTEATNLQTDEQESDEVWGEEDGETKTSKKKASKGKKKQEEDSSSSDELDKSDEIDSDTSSSEEVKPKGQKKTTSVKTATSSPSAKQSKSEPQISSDQLSEPKQTTKSTTKRQTKPVPEAEEQQQQPKKPSTSSRAKKQDTSMTPDESSTEANQQQQQETTTTPEKPNRTRVKKQDTPPAPAGSTKTNQQKETTTTTPEKPKRTSRVKKPETPEL